MSKTQRWEWAISLKLEELSNEHLQAAYKLNWDNLCKFDSCRKNCKRILCLACFDRTWVDNDSANNNSYDNYDTSNCEQKRHDLKSFVGLKNLGATCYVNCLLQLWFHNPALRKAIYEWDKDVVTRIQQDEDTSEQVQTTAKDSHHQQTQQQGSSLNNNNRSSKTLSKRSREDGESPAKKIYKSGDNNDRQVSTISDSRLSPAPTSSSASQSKAPRQKDFVQTSPIEQLQLIFARLQFTNKKSIDPFNFIDSLALNATEQQDAQEFGNLFFELLEKSISNQGNSFVANIIKNQFLGRYSYATICDHCKHSSLSESNFYELDLSIQNLDTLHDCLNEYFRPVPLDGKYNCSHCRKAQSAHRKIILKSLPPTLNLQLLRFVYDKQRNTRQKLNSYIIFPEILDMSIYLKDQSANSRVKTNPFDLTTRPNNFDYLSNGTSKSRSTIYILSAVLIHRGSSPHSGHYIAHIKDRITKDWFKFNDDSVERIGPQLQVSTEGESITIVEDKLDTIKFTDPASGKAIRMESKSLKSKTAYMLVYQAHDNEALTYPSDHSEKWLLPDHLQTAVAEENSKSDEIFESLQIAKEADEQVMNARKDQIKTIYEKLVCRDPSEKFEFIDRNWLQNWLTNSSTTAKFQPVDNSHLLCIHDKLDFRKLDQVKCIRSEGADLLYKEFGGGPRLQDAMCRKCVELEVKLIQLKERMKEDQKYITSQAKFKLTNYDFADAYIVGKNSYRDWQALVMVQFEKSYPELVNRKRENNNQHNSSDEDDSKSVEKQEPSRSNNEEENSDSDDEAMERFVFNSDILCEHNQLIHDTSAWRIVPKEVWMIFKRYFGNDPERPLIENNANTLMCVECKKQEEVQQEIGDVQKQIASEQKSKLPDLFHNRKRASWCSMLPGDEYYALDRQFLAKWQKFIRNPCHQERPSAVKNRDKLICEHGRSLYNSSNSNPILPECQFILINPDELKNLKQFYPIDQEIKFTIDPDLANSKLKLYVASLKASPSKKLTSTQSDNSVNLNKQLDNSGDHDKRMGLNTSISSDECEVAFNSVSSEQKSSLIVQCEPKDEIDLSDIDWSECVVSEPGYCADCHEMMKQDELKKLLNYESATIYIMRVENSGTHGPQNNPNGANNDNCDNDNNKASASIIRQTEMHCPEANNQGGGNHVDSDVIHVSEEEQYPFKRRKKTDVEDECNDFVPPGASKQPAQSSPSMNSILRRTTRRNRNREQAYTIKPTQTLLELKKEIFSRCQVLPVDQRLFLNDILLDDNSKTMSELRIVPNCSLKLEVDRPVSDNIDLIEDEPTSRKSCAQPETGFKGSLLLSNSHL